MIVTCLAWIAKRFTSSNNPTIKFSAASCSAAIAVDWKWTCTEGVPGPSGHIGILGKSLLLISEMEFS